METQDKNGYFHNPLLERGRWQAKNHQLGVDPSPSTSTVDRTVVVKELHKKLDADHEVMSSLENSRGEGGEEQLAAKKTEQAFLTPNAVKAVAKRMARRPPPTKVPQSFIDAKLLNILISIMAFHSPPPRSEQSAVLVTLQSTLRR